MASLALGGCPSRDAISEGQAIAIADSHLRLWDYQDWGHPERIWPPDIPDADGKRWWQLRYLRDGTHLHVFVNAESGWVQQPQRVDPQQQNAAVIADESSRLPAPAAAATLPPGPMIVVCLPAPPAPHRAAEVERLNDLAAAHGRPAAFTVWQDHSIVYGWRGDSGTRPNPALLEWIQAHSGYSDSAWLDLTSY